MEATAPSTGKPAATNPPKTTTMTAKLTGRAMPSPRWPSILTCSMMRSTRDRSPPRWSPVAPVCSARRSNTTSTCSVAAASSSAVLFSSKVTTVAKPPEDGSPSSTNRSACGLVGPSGTTNGLTADSTCSIAVRSLTAAAPAVATAGSVRSTPVRVWV